MAKKETTSPGSGGIEVAVFTTNAETDGEAALLLESLQASFPQHKISLDRSEPKHPNPCGHSMLRLEGPFLQPETVFARVKGFGFAFAVLEETKCNPDRGEEAGFWEAAFQEKQEMWGFEPAQSAVLTKDFFLEKGISNILIPGIGYGRNAQVFRENCIRVTGIEISTTAIELARKYHGTELPIYHGSVTDMPFDNQKYEGIFCYGLLHLFDSAERAKLIADCYDLLSENGYMVFAAISKKAHTYGKGKPAGPDRFEMFGGVSIFFYDRESIATEFSRAGLEEMLEVDEDFPFYLVKCRKLRHPKH